jgi:hypothetical protein
MTMIASPAVEELDVGAESTSKFPVGRESNNYLFVGGNPINRVDPLGLAATATAPARPSASYFFFDPRDPHSVGFYPNGGVNFKMGVKLPVDGSKYAQVVTILDSSDSNRTHARMIDYWGGGVQADTQDTGEKDKKNSWTCNTMYVEARSVLLYRLASVDSAAGSPGVGTGLSDMRIGSYTATANLDPTGAVARAGSGVAGDLLGGYIWRYTYVKTSSGAIRQTLQIDGVSIQDGPAGAVNPSTHQVYLVNGVPAPAPVGAIDPKATALDQLTKFYD